MSEETVDKLFEKYNESLPLSGKSAILIALYMRQNHRFLSILSDGLSSLSATRLMKEDFEKLRMLSDDLETTHFEFIESLIGSTETNGRD